MDSKFFDTLLEPTFVLDAQKQVVYCNEAAALLTDLSVRKLTRSKPKLDELFKFSEELQALKEIQKLNDASPYQELSFSCESGREGRVQVTIQPFQTSSNTNEQAWLVYFRDVTLEETLQKKYRKEFEQKEGYIKELELARFALEDYSKNLEKKVQERTAELSKLNQLMKALLDSLGEGFFIFNQQGDILEIASRACETTVECDPRGQKIWNVLGLAEKQVSGFQKWMTTLFAEMLPFEDLAPLGPPRFPHSKGQVVELQYFPLRNEHTQIEGVVVVASDITTLVQAQKDAEHERANAAMIMQLIRNKRQLATFIRECESMINDLQVELKNPEPNCELTFRLLHTLKGGAATFSVKEISDHCHTAETLLSEYKSFQDDKTLKRLQEQCQMLQPLFANFLKENEAIIGNLQKLAERWVEVPTSRFSKYAKNWLQDPDESAARNALAEEFLFDPAINQFSHISESIQSMATKLGKEVLPLKFVNPEFKLLPEPYEKIFSSLIHAFRNSVDHGIETPEERSFAGKPTAGQISISFNNIADDFYIYIEDDGQGIDPNRIRAKLAERDIDCSHESDEQVIQHIFDSQFSTRESVTEYSGRGVGMDAIAQAAKEMGGSVWVETVLGKGTKLKIKLPWIQSILIRDKQTFAA